MSVELQTSDVLRRNSHPPLRRIARGAPINLDQIDSSQPLFGTQEFAPLESHDSCYSSCSEESHSSLSREPSDAVASESSYQSSSPTPPSTQSNECLVEFATKLGYSEQQLYTVLDKLGGNVGQDQVLSELIKLGRTCNDAPFQTSVGGLNGQSSLTLRSIVIDGSNIAMTHGRKEVFSCAGIKECVQYFRKRGHIDILVFVPHFRHEAARSDCPITDQHILNELDNEKVLVWTPSRHIGGRRIVCHDDRYILKIAEEKDAVIVSNDEYRDLIKENPQYRKLVEQRLLMYSFVDGKFMPPDDPLGRRGPKLSQFLSITPVTPSTQLCPYGRKCTYGNKCKYFHPERPNGVHVSVTERLIKGKQVKLPLKQCVSARPSVAADSSYQRKNSHEAVSRTRSLNVLLSDRMPQNFMQKCQISESINCFQKEQFQMAEASQIQQPQELPNLVPQRSWRHATLNRNLSAPVRRSPPPGRVPFLRERSIDLTGQCSSAAEFAHLGYPINPQMMPPPQFEPRSDNFPTDYIPRTSCQRISHLFAPSTAVWGDPEYGVGPLTRPTFDSMNSIDGERRMRIQQTLRQLFPEPIVSLVMEAYPDETDPQKLCALILEYQKCCAV